MFQDIERRFESMNTQRMLGRGLLGATVLFIIMPVVAYETSYRDPVVGCVVASSIFGLALNLVAMIGNSRNNYFITYIYFALTNLHIVLNFAITISFPFMIILLLLQIFLVVVAFFHARNIRFTFGKHNQYKIPDSKQVGT